MTRYSKATLWASLFFAIVQHPRCFKAEDGSEWDYTAGDHGLTHWPGECATGKSQSPIDIVPYLATQENNMEPFIFLGYDHLGTGMEVVNNGRSVKFSRPEGDKGRKPLEDDFYTGISHGGLPGSKFEFVQGHLHWGSRNEKGSEHTINGAHTPMELHLVHFNQDKGKVLTQAVQTGDYNSLAVLGMSFHISQADNPKLTPLIEAVEKVHEEHDTAILSPVKLDDFLPRNTDRFYRYNGSLTTPACGEIVVWTFFQETLPISEAQMERFRQLHYGEVDHRFNLTDNFRPTQPLNGRKVLDVNTSRRQFTEPDQAATSPAGTSPTGSTTPTLPPPAKTPAARAATQAAQVPNSASQGFAGPFGWLSTATAFVTGFGFPSTGFCSLLLSGISSR